MTTDFLVQVGRRICKCSGIIDGVPMCRAGWNLRLGLGLGLGFQMPLATAR